MLLDVIGLDSVGFRIIVCCLGILLITGLLALASGLLYLLV